MVIVVVVLDVVNGNVVVSVNVENFVSVNEIEVVSIDVSKRVSKTVNVFVMVAESERVLVTPLISVVNMVLENL